MVAEAITAARAAGAAGEIIVRGDAAFYAAKLISTCRRARVRFSVTVPVTRAIRAAIATIGEDAWVDIKYPHAIFDEDDRRWISDAQIAEICYTAFAGTRHETTARLVVRRVRDANTQDPLFPVWRYHPFFTNTTETADQADITHRQHAICETVWSDLIDGAWAHQPSGTFAANAAWSILAAICHNLLRAAATLTSTARYAVARGATLRTHLINIPARLARPQRRPVLHLPAHWPRATAWLHLWRAVFIT
jgi:hypothetical protein